MTTEDRCNLYSEYKNRLALIQDLKSRIEAANKAAEEAFQREKKNDIESAYKAGDEAGWGLVDELNDILKVTEEEFTKIYKQLYDNAFDLSKYQSCCAYGLSIKKKVKVMLLDGTELYGEIYPWVYDNPQEMWLVQENGDEYDLDRGWEVKEVHFV